MSATRTTLSVMSLAAFAAVVACAGGEQPAASSASSTPPAANAAPSGPQTPDPGGKVVTVELSSDATGNYFKPNEVHVKKGDVVRYTLKVGVHNVHFLPDSNAGKTGYPTAPSDLLQLPETYDVLVHLDKGTYYFQCDPHAALGMKGHVIVE